MRGAAPLLFFAGEKDDTNEPVANCVVGLKRDFA